jgi:hypothetical protein
VNTAHIYRGNGSALSLGVGFDDFLSWLPETDTLDCADLILAESGWRRTGDWSQDAPLNPRTGLWTAPIEEAS